MDHPENMYSRSTLIRFLGDIGRTDELIVADYERFLNRIEESSPINELAQSLHMFYGREVVDTGVSEQQSDSPSIADKSYITDVRPEPPQPTMIPYSEISFATVPGTSIKQVKERIHNPSRAMPESLTNKRHAVPFEGVGYWFGQSLTIMQRHIATALPRTVRIDFGAATSGEPLPVTVQEIRYEDRHGPLSDRVTEFTGLLHVRDHSND